MLIKLLTFRSGHTGISVPSVKRLMEFWNNGVIPATPKKGTVGPVVILAPLAHMALPLLGMGKVHFRGRVQDAAPVLKEMGWEPLRLKPKEGLAFTNGVQYINAHAADCLMQLEELIKCGDVLAALSAQAFSASRTFYQAPYHETAYHHERRTVAANLRTLLEGSNHFELPTCNRSKQDPYSFRCTPQVHAAIRQAFGFAKDVVEKECNGVSDNPLFFPELDTILFGGNLHGQSTAFALDFLAMAASELASISERRTYQLLSGQRGLPSFLVKHPGSQLRDDDYAVHVRRPGQREQAAVHARQRGYHPDLPAPGGPREHGRHVGLQADDHRRELRLRLRDRAAERRTGHRAERRPSALAGYARDRAKRSGSRCRFLENDRVLSNDIERSRAFLLENKRAWATELGLS